VKFAGKPRFFERISPFQKSNFQYFDGLLKSLRGYVLWGLFGEKGVFTLNGGLKWTLSTFEILTETQFFLYL